MKVASTNGTSGYSWLVDRENCTGIIDVTNEYFYNSASEDSVYFSFGIEIFTLTAQGPGECLIQLAYADPKNFASFEDHAN